MFPYGTSLTKLDAADTKLAGTPQGMRQLLDRYARDDTLTNNIRNVAHFQSLATCDHMTMLAFRALQDRERYIEQIIEHLNINISARRIFVDPARNADEILESINAGEFLKPANKGWP